MTIRILVPLFFISLLTLSCTTHSKEPCEPVAAEVSLGWKLDSLGCNGFRSACIADEEFNYKSLIANTKECVESNLGLANEKLENGWLLYYITCGQVEMLRADPSNPDSAEFEMVEDDEATVLIIELLEDGVVKQARIWVP